ncbi:hypothetical protein TrCOL_g4718 [Triparma columacea]|uniref:Uncharacterized protein n=1 Tax=Triparma columacea TaxID=722753 RepID=A0A9W7LFK5_9STRA|nr:hypothetical protein TrCOL_g4718 [Triparma columacea]
MEEFVRRGGGNVGGEGGEKRRGECGIREVATMSCLGVSSRVLQLVKSKPFPYGSGVTFLEEGRVEVYGRTVTVRDGIVEWMKGMGMKVGGKDTGEGERRERRVRECIEREMGRGGRKERMDTDRAVFEFEML